MSEAWLCASIAAAAAVAAALPGGRAMMAVWILCTVCGGAVMRASLREESAACRVCCVTLEVSDSMSFPGCRTVRHSGQRAHVAPAALMSWSQQCLWKLCRQGKMHMVCASRPPCASLITSLQMEHSPSCMACTCTTLRRAWSLTSLLDVGSRVGAIKISRGRGGCASGGKSL